VNTNDYNIVFTFVNTNVYALVITPVLAVVWAFVLVVIFLIFQICVIKFKGYIYKGKDFLCVK